MFLPKSFRESSNTSGNGDSSITSHKNEVGKNLHYLTRSDKRLREIENWLEHFEISKSVNVKKRKFPLIILTPLYYRCNIFDGGQCEIFEQ